MDTARAKFVLDHALGQWQAYNLAPILKGGDGLIRVLPDKGGSTNQPFHRLSRANCFQLGQETGTEHEWKGVAEGTRMKVAGQTRPLFTDF